METRTYAPIWNRLKALSLEDARAKGISVTANRKLHPRIIKAVTKEKWQDTGYKILMEPHKMLMYHTSKGAILTFYLVQSKTAFIKNISSHNV